MNRSRRARGIMPAWCASMLEEELALALALAFMSSSDSMELGDEPRIVNVFPLPV